MICARVRHNWWTSFCQLLLALCAPVLLTSNFIFLLFFAHILLLNLAHICSKLTINSTKSHTNMSNTTTRLPQHIPEILIFLWKENYENIITGTLEQGRLSIAEQQHTCSSSSSRTTRSEPRGVRADTEGGRHVYSWIVTELHDWDGRILISTNTIVRTGACALLLPTSRNPYHM